ncbi:hypothetical protein KIW84_071966 [Lathyrus oleraceus]|uniref:Uncharacterized protein n=1 Tax=Pisum sativum TaxID=3888 RepID=A0A9D4ZUF7_PEA|nr:hypothetical protein KIW84_071966 [Pisum sativum]
MTEALICTHNWLKPSFTYFKDLNLMEDFELSEDIIAEFEEISSAARRGSLPLGERGMHVEELERELKLLLDRIKLSGKALEDEGMVFSILPQIMLWPALSIMLWSGLGGSGSPCNSRTKT